MSAVIPSLDFSKAKTHRQELASQLTRALEGVGFLYLDNVEGFDPDELLRATKWFFSLPLEKRLATAPKRWNPASKNAFRGYFPLIPGGGENKEALEIGPEISPDDPFFKAGYAVYTREVSGRTKMKTARISRKRFGSTIYDVVSNVAAEVLRLLAFGMGFDEHSFDSMLPKSVSTLCLMHYPVRDTDLPPLPTDGKDMIQCAAHSDMTFSSFLATFENRGLEILDCDRKWVEVEPRPHSLVVNIGQLLAQMSRNRFKAT